MVGAGLWVWFRCLFLSFCSCMTTPSLTRDIFPPQCGGNPTDRWLAEIRKDGWLADRKRFDSEPEARTWADAHTGEMSKGVAGEYIHMIHRWNNK